MTAPIQTRLPFAPLLALVRLEYRPPSTWADVGLTQGDVALALGVSRRAVVRWAKAGELPYWSADAAAVALGRHPVEVWGPAWWDTEPLEAVA